MGPIEAFLLGMLLTAGINSIGIKYIKDQHAKEKACLVAKLSQDKKKLVKTVHEATKQGSFSMDEGGAHIQVNTGKDTKTRVCVEKEGNGRRVTINSSNTVGKLSTTTD